MAQLIVISGLPGTGKSGVAEALGAQLHIPVFAKDWLEASLLESGAVRPDQLGRVGYDLLTTLAQRQLALGQSAILDSVAGSVAIRTKWEHLALNYGASRTVIECICSDVEVHRQRITGRRRSIPGWHELEWSDVERTTSQFVPWTEERLVLDAMNAVEANLAEALRFLSEQRTEMNYSTYPSG